MSNLKLYEGINNIDDDLIEEADRKHKPVIHRYYSFAASAAAIMIVAGVSGWGLFHNGKTIKDPSLFNSNIVSEVSVTTAPSVQSASDSSTEAASKQTDAAPAEYRTAAAGTSVRNTKTNPLSTNNIGITSEIVSVTVQALPAEIKKPTDNSKISEDNTTTEAVQTTTASETIDYESEGRIIMKKVLALSTAMLMLSNGAALNVKAETYKPVNEELEDAQRVKEWVEEYNVDLDINNDGKIDIFDVYAVYLCEHRPVSSVYEPDDTAIYTVPAVPDYILDNYNALPKLEYHYWDEVNSIYETNYYSIYSSQFADYLFTYYPLQLEYFEPDYYIENCPDDYNYFIPLDVQKHDIDVWNTYDFVNTMYYTKNSEGNFEPINITGKVDPEDIPVIDKNDDSYNYYCYMKKQVQYISVIHRFIENIRYSANYTGGNFSLLDELIKNGYLDMDINSDGEYNFDDIILLSIYQGIGRNDISESRYLYYNNTEQIRDYDDYISNYINDDSFTFTENEWNKALRFYEVTGNYLTTYRRNVLIYTIKNYLINNKIDSKYFDPNYYRNLKADSQCYTRIVFDEFDFTYYLDFALTFGPGLSDPYTPTEEDFKRFNYSKKDIEEAFPTYYKNVKTGVLPEPDIDMNGVINVADYNILYNLNREHINPFDELYTQDILNHYPILKVTIKVLPEIRDNYNNNFDFNENGISCDKLETECMMMYILNELSSQYENQDKLNEAFEYYIHSHPGIQYDTLFKEKLDRFNSSKNYYDFNYLLEADETATLSNSVKTLSSFMSGINLADLRTGDANCDNETGLADALLILQNAANSEKYPITNMGIFNADVYQTGDGITPMDALEIQKWDSIKSFN